ncbi:MAG: PhoU domain-containing protein [Acidobacteriota bacterium]|nr:PhoU domain-containing protein [Acidobacteriota bacterium]MDQ7087789.1 PhoU domain-containing protein [Acidobacteriota bacterium]
MFKKLIELLGRESQLNQAFERSREMLTEDQEMFEAAVRSLRESDDARLEIDIYAKDQMINAYEREVRRKVMTHLAVGGEPDIHAALVLVSIVIDIERIGDYTKNIVELALHHPERLTCGPCEPDMRKIETTVRTMFSLLIAALPDSDEDKAREVMSEHWWIARRSDEIVNRLLEEDDPTLPGKEAVATTLYARYLKRISAHLKNIASSIVNPFDRIGYRGQN